MNQPPDNRQEKRNPAKESLYTRKGLIRFMKSEGFFTSRALGQHFLINKKVLLSVLDKAHFPQAGPVLEIGPGLGHLTGPLLERGLHVIAIEKDNLFADRLPRWIEHWQWDASRFTLFHQDALKTDFKSLAEQFAVRHVIGNLPYNVSVPILFRLAYCGTPFDSICVMVQKEVGERMVAEQGSKHYGRLSIVLSSLFHCKKVLTVTPGAFYPPPRVDSVFLQLTPQENTDIAFTRQLLEPLAQVGFQHRRKKLRNNLQGKSIQKLQLVGSLFDRIENEFNLDARAEEWPVQEWIRFAQWIRHQTAHH